MKKLILKLIKPLLFMSVLYAALVIFGNWLTIVGMVGLSIFINGIIFILSPIGLIIVVAAYAIKGNSKSQDEDCDSTSW